MKTLDGKGLFSWLDAMDFLTGCSASTDTGLSQGWFSHVTDRSANAAARRTGEMSSTLRLGSATLHGGDGAENKLHASVEEIG